MGHWGDGIVLKQRALRWRSPLKLWWCRFHAHRVKIVFIYRNTREATKTQTTEFSLLSTNRDSIDSVRLRFIQNWKRFNHLIRKQDAKLQPPKKQNKKTLFFFAKPDYKSSQKSRNVGNEREKEKKTANKNRRMREKKKEQWINKWSCIKLEKNSSYSHKHTHKHLES